MGDHQQGCAGFAPPLEQQLDNIVPGCDIEIAGRLVGEDQRRARGNGAGDGNTLLLAARKLGGIMIEPVAKADCFQFRTGACLRIGLSGKFHRGGDIFQRGHRRQQVEGLQHDPDPATARAGEAILVHRHEILPGDIQIAAAGAFEARKHRHERALARAGRAEQRKHLAFAHIEVDPAQDFHRRAVLAERQGEIAGGDCRAGRVLTCHSPAIA